MKLTITNDREEESESMLFVPEMLYANIVTILHEHELLPTSQRTTTIGDEPDTCPCCFGNGKIPLDNGTLVKCTVCKGTGQA